MDLDECAKALADEVRLDGRADQYLELGLGTALRVTCRMHERNYGDAVCLSDGSQGMMNRGWAKTCAHFDVLGT